MYVCIKMNMSIINIKLKPTTVLAVLKKNSICRKMMYIFYGRIMDFCAFYSLRNIEFLNFVKKKLVHFYILLIYCYNQLHV